jgi:hypothetical protein
MDEVDDFRTLRRLNWTAATLHFALVVTAVIIVFDKGSVDSRVFWGTAEWNNTKCAAMGYDEDITLCPNFDPTADGHHEFSIDFSWLLICSQCITSAAHVYQALLSRPGTWFVRWLLQYGIKPLSWMEYIFTAALTNHILLYYSGQLDVRAHIVGYAAQGTLMVIGLTQDILRQWSLRFKPDVGICKTLISGLFVLGFLNLLSVWFPSLYVLWINTPSDQSPPAFVKWIVLFEFLLYSSFGIAQLVFFLPYIIYDVEKYKPRYFAEQITLDGLSLASKFVLNIAFSSCFIYQICG